MWNEFAKKSSEHWQRWCWQKWPRKFCFCLELPYSNSKMLGKMFEPSVVGSQVLTFDSGSLKKQFKIYAKKLHLPLVMGLGQPSLAWACIWKISPKNLRFYNFFPLDQKKSLGVRSKVLGSKTGQPHIYCAVKSMLGSGRVRAHLYHAVVLNKDFIPLYMTQPSTPKLGVPD